MSDKDEQAAARVLGFTQASWDNASGLEKQPPSTLKKWDQLTFQQRAAAAVLGYSELIWNRVDEIELPAAMAKRWVELISHGEY